MKSFIKKIPHPGKYKTTVLGLAINDAIGLALPLSIISLPVGLAVAVATIGIVAATGLRMTPPPADNSEFVTSEPRKSPLQRVKGGVRTAIAFVKTAFTDPDYMLPAGALGAGALLFAQACLGISFLATMPPVIAAAGITGCAAVAGFGLYVTYLGAVGRWRSLLGIYDKVFHKTRPARAEKTSTGNFLQKKFVRKILNSPLGKILHGPTQRQKDLMMLAPSFPGTLFVSAAALLLMGKYALSALTLGPAAVVAPFLVAFWWGSGPFVNLYPQTKVLLRSLRNKKSAKAVPVPTPVIGVTPTPVAVPLPVIKPLTDEFKSAVEAANENQKNDAAPKTKTAKKSPAAGLKSSNG